MQLGLGAEALADILKEKDLEIARLETKLARQDRGLRHLRQQQLERELYAAAHRVVQHQRRGQEPAVAHSKNQNALGSWSASGEGQRQERQHQNAEGADGAARVDDKDEDHLEGQGTATSGTTPVVTSTQSTSALRVTASERLPQRPQADRFRITESVSEQTFRPVQAVSTRSEEYFGVQVLPAAVAATGFVADFLAGRGPSASRTPPAVLQKNAPARAAEREKPSNDARQTSEISNDNYILGSRSVGSVAVEDVDSKRESNPTTSVIKKLAVQISSEKAAAPARVDISEFPSQLALLVDLHARFRRLVHTRALTREDVHLVLRTSAAVPVAEKFYNERVDLRHDHGQGAPATARPGEDPQAMGVVDTTPPRRVSTGHHVPLQQAPENIEGQHTSSQHEEALRFHLVRDVASRRAFEWLKQRYTTEYFRVKLEPHPYFSHFARAQKTVVLDQVIKAEMQRFCTTLGMVSDLPHTGFTPDSPKPAGQASSEDAAAAPTTPQYLLPAGGGAGGLLVGNENGSRQGIAPHGPILDLLLQATTTSLQEQAEPGVGERFVSGELQVQAQSARDVDVDDEREGAKATGKPGMLTGVAETTEDAGAARPEEEVASSYTTATAPALGFLAPSSRNKAIAHRSTATAGDPDDSNWNCGDLPYEVPGGAPSLWQQTERIIRDELSHLASSFHDEYNLHPADILESLDTVVVLLAQMLELPVDLLRARALVVSPESGSGELCEFVASAEDCERFPSLLQGRSSSHTDEVVDAEGVEVGVGGGNNTVLASTACPGGASSPKSRVAQLFSTSPTTTTSNPNAENGNAMKSNTSFPVLSARELNTDALCEALVYCLSVSMSSSDLHTLQKMVHFVSEQQSANRLGKAGFILSVFEVAVGEALGPSTSCTTSKN
mmetsp:Transcript_16493/g.40826  ORF Transcript_16493/g.40826 Transcript_16493/m.40826 type:complete len:899 (-) Transcript_16493:297-2993(-)